MKKYIAAIILSIFLLIGVSTLLVLTIMTKLQDEKIDFVSIGNRNKENGHYGQAIDNYAQALEKNSDIPDVYINEAQIYIIKNRTDDAIKILQKGLTYVNIKDKLNLLLGQIYYDKEDYTNALTYLSKYFLTNKTDEVAYDLGRISFHNKDFDAARKYFSPLSTYKSALFELSILDNSDLDKALNDLAAYKSINGTNMSQMPEWENDLNVVKNAINDKKADPIVKTYIATALNHADRCEIAIPILLSAIEAQEKISPFINARIYLGDCYYKTGQYTDAKTILEKTFSVDKSTKEIRQVLALVYQKTGNQDKALTMYKELIALENNNVDFRKSLVDQELNMKMFTEAISDIDQLEKLGNDPIYEFKKASILIDNLQKYQDASIYLSPMIADLTRANILDLYGWTQFKLGLTDGLKYINLAISANDKYAQAYYHRGMLTKDDPKTVRQAKIDFYNAVDYDTTGQTEESLKEYNLLH